MSDSWLIERREQIATNGGSGLWEITRRAKGVSLETTIVSYVQRSASASESLRLKITKTSDTADREIKLLDWHG